MSAYRESAEREPEPKPPFKWPELAWRRLLLSGIVLLLAMLVSLACAQVTSLRLGPVGIWMVGGVVLVDLCLFLAAIDKGLRGAA